VITLKLRFYAVLTVLLSCSPCRAGSSTVTIVYQPILTTSEDVTDIAEAALECVRRLARDTKKRPQLIITGKRGDEAKWQKHFEQHDLAKPFNRPSA
jgi:hypothetical protein